MHSIRQTAKQLREQMERFSGIVFPGFSKPKRNFLQQMLFGIHAAQDVKLSNIGRALGEDIPLKKTEERLSHHLAEPGLARELQRRVADLASSRVGKDTLIVVDPTDIKKPYGKVMPYLATVRDGSAKELVKGYWACAAVACEAGARRVTPLHLRLWSAEAPDFTSENDELLAVVDTIREATQGRGIYVIDRGGDRIRLFEPLLDRKLRFIVRLVGDRHLEVKDDKVEAASLAKTMPLGFKEVVVKMEGAQERRLELEYGACEVKLPGRPERLWMVVVRGLGSEPTMILTNVEVGKGRKQAWFVVKGYLTRWMVEETIRFIKQSYQLEDVRVLEYDRLRNVVGIVLAVVYFTAVWLGESLKMSVLLTKATSMAKRFFGVPDFHYYAIADGVGALLRNLGKFHAPKDADPPEEDSGPQMAFSF